MKKKTNRDNRYVKFLLYLALPLYGAASLSSCADLDQEPVSSISSYNFYKSEDELKTAINGIYEVATEDGFYGMFNNQSIYFNDLQTDYVKSGANTNSAHIRELSNFAVSTSNIFVIDSWNEHYKGINLANQLIDKVEASSNFTDEVKKLYIGQASFMRALYYFNLVRYFGDVPLVLHSSEAEGRSRDALDNVYAQIVKDLETAEAYIPASVTGSDGSATSGAATALLSKVYLVWAQTSLTLSQADKDSNIQKASDYASKVIDSRKYKLIDKFIDNWSVDKKNGAEHIFSIQHDRTVNPNVSGHCTFAMLWSDSEPVLITTSTKYWEEEDANDQRRDGSWAKKLYNPRTGKDFVFKTPLFRKYIDSLNYAAYGNSAGQSTNTTYLRYAEVLLIKAEAENELHGPTSAAYDAINEVRRRAYWSPYQNKELAPSDGSPVKLQGLNQEQFRQAVRDEYRKEFVLEGRRWLDLVRWHILVKYVKEQYIAHGGSTSDLKYKNVSKRNYRLPIPNDQITLNKNLKQNWGYSGENENDPYVGWE